MVQAINMYFFKSTAPIIWFLWLLKTLFVYQIFLFVVSFFFCFRYTFVSSAVLNRYVVVDFFNLSNKVKKMRGHVFLSDMILY